MKCNIRTSVAFAAILATASAVFGQVELPQWKVVSARISLSSGPWSGRLNAVVSLTSNPREVKAVGGDVVSAAIGSTFVVGDRLVVLGEAGRTQAVEVFDIPSGRKVDWFFCYTPARISETRIASVEYYPSMSAGTPTDVVLLYDLAKSPEENRLMRAARIPPLRGDRPIQVGVPVFPDRNALQGSYDNHVESSDDSYAVAGSFYRLIGGNKLVFIAMQFNSDGQRKTTEAVIADLTKGPSRLNAQTIVVPAYEGHPVDVVDARELSPEKLELSLSQNGQPLRRVVVAIDMAKK